MNRSGLQLFRRSVRTILVSVVLTAVAGSPALAQNKALLIGNTDYNAAAEAAGWADLPGVITDVLQKHNALANAGWTVMNMENLTATEITDAITANIPPDGKQYFVWYAGHGDTDNNGELVGVKGNNVTAAAFVAALGAAVDRTTVKLDSCGSGGFADDLNTAAGGDSGGLAVISATTDGTTCTSDVDTFTTCFAAGLNGAADGADGSTPDGVITAAEAGAYATDTCGGAYDGDNGTWVLGAPKEGAGFCTLPDGRCVDNISQSVCEEKGGKWDAGVCIPTVSEWGLVVMGLLVLTAGTVVVMRRRRAVEVA